MKTNTRFRKYMALILIISMLPFQSFIFEKNVYAMQPAGEIESNTYAEAATEENEKHVSENEIKEPLKNSFESGRDIVLTEDYVLTESISVNSLTIQSGNLDLNGKTLTVEKDCIHSNGELVIQGGCLIVKGDYRQQNQDEEGTFTTGFGTLVMNQPEDYVLIYGDMYVETQADTRGKITDGVLELKGSFIHTYKSYYDFVAEENHTLKLSGNESQIVHMEKCRLTGTHLNHVEIMNESKEGVVFENSPTVIGRITDYKNKVSGEIGIGKSTQIGQGHFGGSISFLENYVLKQGVEWEIEGNVSIGYNIDIQGILRVGGNAVLNNGHYISKVRMQKGQFLIDGDLTLKSYPAFI